MRRLRLVANPSASGFTGALHRDVATTLKESFEVDPVWPDDPDGAKRAAADAADAGFDVVAAMGGDGVVHHVANGLAGSATALGVIPAGTTNVFARIQGIASKPREAAADLAASGQRRAVPLAHLALEQGPTYRSVYATFAAGIGFDAEVVRIAEQRPTGKLRFAGIHYARTLFGVLRRDYRHRAASLRVESEGKRADGVAMMVQVQRPFTYFGKLPLSLDPADSPDLIILTLSNLRARTAALLAPRLLLRRRLDAVGAATVWKQVTKAIVDAEPAADLQVDGELYHNVTAAEVSVAPNHLFIAT